MYICIIIYVYVCVYIYIYIYTTSRCKGMHGMHGGDVVFQAEHNIIICTVVQLLDCSALIVGHIAVYQAFYSVEDVVREFIR